MNQTLAGVEYVDEADRVRIRLDKPLPRSAGIQLKQAGCVRVSQRPIHLEYHPRWAAELRITRPTQACLVSLEELLGENRIGSEPCALEIARDFLTSEPNSRAYIEQELLRSIVLRHRLPRVKRSGSCYFWGHRGDDVRIAMYGDRPHKQPDLSWAAACVHIEIRLLGAPTLRKYGVWSAGDLSHFDYESAWKRAVDMICLPANKSALGRLLGPKNVSGTALRKRATRFLAQGAIRNSTLFAVQNVISPGDNGARRQLPRRITRMDFNDWTRAVAQERIT